MPFWGVYPWICCRFVCLFISQKYLVSASWINYFLHHLVQCTAYNSQNVGDIKKILWNMTAVIIVYLSALSSNSGTLESFFQFSFSVKFLYRYHFQDHRVDQHFFICPKNICVTFCLSILGKVGMNIDLLVKTSHLHKL